jgi:DNA-binding response OmpR family regulator
MAVVLVVNDDRDLLDMYADALQAMGHEAVTKESIDADPQTVRQVGGDALLVDLQTPDEDEFGLPYTSGGPPSSVGPPPPG